MSMSITYIPDGTYNGHIPQLRKFVIWEDDVTNAFEGRVDWLFDFEPLIHGAISLAVIAATRPNDETHVSKVIVQLVAHNLCSSRESQEVSEEGSVPW